MFNNSKSKFKKVLILLLVIAITYSNFLLVGANFYKGLISYATDELEIPSDVLLVDEQEEVIEPIFEINVEIPDIHKTQMTDVTEFIEKVDLKVKNVKNIQFEDVENGFYNQEDEAFEGANLQYVKTTINKEELIKVLGEKGTFNVLDDQNKDIVALSTEYINKLDPEQRISQNYTVMVEVENEDGTKTRKRTKRNKILCDSN